MKKIALVVVALALSIGLMGGLALAKSLPDDVVLDQDGLYDEPGHPGIKVRVIVHHERPGQASLSSLVCNLSDPDSTATVGAAGWHLPSAVTYNLNPDSVPASVGGASLATIANNGFNDWSAASGNMVSFTKGSNTSVARSAYDGKNVIAWGRTSGSALGVTYIRYNTSTGLVVDVDTIMNKKFTWSWSNSDTCADSATYDAENILTHELGHWTGLDDMYDAANYQNATMYGYGPKGEVKKNTLSTGDKAGVFDIYNN